MLLTNCKGPDEGRGGEARQVEGKIVESNPILGRRGELSRVEGRGDESN